MLAEFLRAPSNQPFRSTSSALQFDGIARLGGTCPNGHPRAPGQPPSASLSESRRCVSKFRTEWFVPKAATPSLVSESVIEGNHSERHTLPSRRCKKAPKPALHFKCPHPENRTGFRGKSVRLLWRAYR